jgi:hypothetical protein
MSVPAAKLRWIIAGGVLISLWVAGAEDAVVVSGMDDEWVATWLAEHIEGRAS